MVFAADGIWARFLQPAEGYIATDLKCEAVDDGRYRVRDFWSGHRGFEVFRERFAKGFAEFDRQVVDQLAYKQQLVGAYYETDGD